MGKRFNVIILHLILNSVTYQPGVVEKPNDQVPFNMEQWAIGQSFVVQSEVNGELVATGEYTLEAVVPDLKADLINLLTVLKQMQLVDAATIALIFVELNEQDLKSDDSARILQLFTKLMGPYLTAGPLLEPLVQQGLPLTFTNLVNVAYELGYLNLDLDIAAINAGAADRFLALIDYHDYVTDYSSFAPTTTVPFRINHYVGNAKIVGFNADLSVRLANA